MGKGDSENVKHSQWIVLKQKIRGKQTKGSRKKPIPTRPLYFVTAKPRGGTIKGPNDANNSSKQANKYASPDKQKPANSNRQKSTTSPRKTAASPRKEKTQTKQSSPKTGDAIFLSPPRAQKELAADVIRADCMVRGYKVGSTVGEGAYAKVKIAEVLPSKLVRNEQLADLAAATDGELFVAIKIIECKNVPKEFLKKFLPRELNNHCPLPHHENVVRVFEQFRTNDRYYVVMEYCNKGDLLDLINRRISESCKGIGEDMARTLFKMMAEGVHHIHLNGIVHRDLKCENILLNHHDVIKITDFGFSTQFIPNKTAPLKTSCGSYAYTAPEVIKMKPYDGTKSDAWSLGIILFAMLNGRLPFNDAQLNELEDDMKMQRLRFERNVSFESMVLVRRILQYNPAHRPTLAEVIADPWLTGKRPIPRQPNKPKWINPYSPRRDDGDPSGPAKSPTQTPQSSQGSGLSASPGQPCYYKGTVPERGTEATVTVNHDKCETVVLKSRTGRKKNIWTRGPPTSQRPNTWPRACAEAARAKQTSGARGRGSSANERKTPNTAVVVRQPDTRGKQTRGEGNTVNKNIKFSKWFMDKYMAGLEEFDSIIPDDNCQCCQAEATVKHIRSQKKFDPVVKGDTSGTVEDFDSLSDIEDPGFFKFPNSAKNKGDVAKAYRVLSAEKNGSSKIETKSELAKKDVQKEIISTAHARKSAPATRATAGRYPSQNRQPPAEKKTNQVIVKDMVVSCRTTTSKPTDTPRHNMSSYMISKSTTPAERVKYFRDRLMKLYGNDKPEHDISELPPLMVQSLKPSAGSPKATEDSQATAVSPASHKPATNQTANQFLRNRCATSGPKARPVQRVIVHSSML